MTVELERWVHMAKDGWYSGELHIHANYGYGSWFNTPETMRQQCVGEDLNVCNFMVANSDADVVFDRPFFRGGPDPLSTPENILYWNQEFRSTIWGHMTLVNLEQVVEPVFTGFEGTTNPWDTPSNADIADRTHWQKGVVNYTHVSQAEDWSKTPYAAKAIPIDVALGKIDTLDINNSWAASVPLWYRLLNCGFRVPATAGTDVFLNRIGSNLPGGDRVYVHIDGPLTYAGWIDGLKAGRSFVTNGPMLTFTVNGERAGGGAEARREAEGPREGDGPVAVPAGEGGAGPQRQGDRDGDARRRQADARRWTRRSRWTAAAGWRSGPTAPGPPTPPTAGPERAHQPGVRRGRRRGVPRRRRRPGRS